MATIKLFNSLAYPELHSKSERFSLHNDKEYVSLKATIKSVDHEFARQDYLKFVSEYHEPDHTPNFVVREGHTYIVGSSPRVDNNFDQLSPEAKELAKAGPSMTEPRQPALQERRPGRGASRRHRPGRSRCSARVKPRREPLVEVKPHAAAASASSRCRGAPSGTSTSSTPPATSGGPTSSPPRRRTCAA